MNYLTRLKNSNNGIVRTITVALFGADDARSAPEASPWGDDGNPIPGMQAVYLQTSKSGEPVIAGYFISADNPLSPQKFAHPGEKRIFATDANGNEQAKIWLHNNGTVEIAGGSAALNVNHSVQWEALNLQIQSAVINAINTQLPLIAAGIAAGGGSYSPTLLSLDLTSSKIAKILVP